MVRSLRQYRLCYSIPRVAIPKGRNPACLGSTFQDAVYFTFQPHHVLADQGVGAQGHGDRALGVLAHSQAGHPKVGCLLLDTARVGDDDQSVLL